MLKLFITTTILALLCQVTYAKKIKARFGKVTKEEMNYVCETDTSAVAVVLYKHGFFNKGGIEYTLFKRIKILKKSGVDYANMVINGYDITVKGKVYNLVNGEIEEKKLKPSQIFKDRITDTYSQHRIAFSNVKEGSVIDIMYTKYLGPEYFLFQEEIPVRYAKLETPISDIIQYRTRFQGYEDINTISEYEFEAYDVPAFKKEAYLNSMDNYITKIEFDIVAYQSSIDNGRLNLTGRSTQHSSSWKSINKKLLKHPYFGVPIVSNDKYLEVTVKQIEGTCHTDEDKIKAAYNAIKELEWDKSYSLFTSNQNLSFAYSKHTANSAELNLMLVQLLNALNIKSEPIVTSTRSNGLINKVYPSFSQLDYVIALAETDGKLFLMDATEDYLPVGMLPPRCLNGFGHAVNQTNGYNIDLTPQYKDLKRTGYELTLNSDLSLEGDYKTYHFDYNGYEFRKRYHEYLSEDDFITKKENSHIGLRIKEGTLLNIDSLEKPVVENYKVNITKIIDKIGDLVLINPFFYDLLNENPFKLEKRKYPINYPVLQEKLLISKLTIPSGITVEELPESQKIVLDSNSAGFLVSYSQEDNVITTTFLFKINKLLFLPDEYELLKNLYDLVIEQMSKPIVLKM